MKTTFIILLMMVAIISSAQNVNIPDANFKSTLIGLGIDTNDDGEISQSEAEAVTSLDVSEKNISDLTGIEAFTNLEILFCNNNQLTSLDVSKNTSLTYLYCYNNQLSSLDVSQNTGLDYLYCNDNQLTSLDVSNNTVLTILGCWNNQLSSLDVSNNTSLTSLYCNGNQLSNLDVTSNTSLTSLYCNGNQLSSLNVSNNPVLSELDCHENHLTGLDVSACVALTVLACWHNHLTSLDVSMNTALVELLCYYNFLTTLLLSNNPALEVLGCSHNLLTHLDISLNTALIWLDISLMPTLGGVCVWTLPFPPAGLEVHKDSSNSVFYTTDCSLIAPAPCTTKDETLAGEGFRIQQNLTYFPDGDNLEGFMQRGDVIALSARVSDQDYIKHLCICDGDTTSTLWGPYSDNVYYEWTLQGDGKLIIPDDQSGTVFYELPICITGHFTATIILKVKNGETSMATDEEITGSFTIEVSPSMPLLTDPNNPPPAGWGLSLIITLTKKDLSNGGDSDLPTEEDAFCNPEEIAFETGSDIQVKGGIIASQGEFCKPDYAVLLKADASDLDTYKLKCVGELGCESEDSIVKPFNDPLRYEWTIVSGKGAFPLGNLGKSVVFHKSRSEGAIIKCTISNIDTKSNDGSSKEITIMVNAAEKPKALVGLGDDENTKNASKLILEWWNKKRVYGGREPGFLEAAKSMKTAFEKAGYEVEFQEQVKRDHLTHALQDPIYQAIALVGHGSIGRMYLTGPNPIYSPIYSSSDMIGTNQYAYGCPESPRIADLQLLGCEGLLGSWKKALHRGARLHGWKTTKRLGALRYYAYYTFEPRTPINLSLE